MWPVRSCLRRRVFAPWIWRAMRRMAASVSSVRRGVVEDLAQERRIRAESSCFFSSCFWRSTICSMSLGKAAQYLLALLLQLADERLVHVQVVQMVDEALEVRGGDVERQFLAAVAVGDEVAGLNMPRARRSFSWCVMRCSA